MRLNVAVLIGEHRFGLLPSHHQELVVLQSGSWQSSKMPFSCDIPPPEDFLFCLDNAPAGSLAPDVGAFEECSAVSDGASLKASAAVCLDAEDSEDSSHHGGLEAVVPSMRSSTSAVLGTESPWKGIFKERIYSCGKTILLESQAKYACHLCPYMTKSKAAMISHRRKHKGVLPHKCDICGRGFLQHSTLLYHLRTHTGERPYACSICPSTFACRSTLNAHMRKHTGERPYCCDKCDRAFRGLSSLMSHKRWHADGKPYVCPICAETFAKKGMLDDHLNNKVCCQ